MNKKEISHIRRQFKSENENIKINNIFTMYIQKESGDIYHHEMNTFNLHEKETQELLLNNFKKVLTGTVGAKLFTLRFNRAPDIANTSQDTLYDGLKTDALAER